jgi:hypothetical protein
MKTSAFAMIKKMSGLTDETGHFWRIKNNLNAISPRLH